MTRIGPYEILRELGRGAMGIVYLAQDPQIQRHVANKTIQLHPSFSAAQQIAIFARQNIARLDVPMHDSLAVSVVEGLGDLAQAVEHRAFPQRRPVEH